jgi:hypothetical protein
MKQHYTIHSIRITEETERLLHRVYGKLFAERFNANQPLMTKDEAFGEIVRKVAHLEGVNV